MPENKDELKQIHTFQSDAAEAIAHQNISRAKIFVTEQEKKVEEGTYIAPKNKIGLNIRFIFVALLFLCGAGVGGYYLYLAHTKPLAVPEKIALNPEQSIISYDSITTIPLSTLNRRSEIETISKEKGKHSANGVYLIAFDATSDQFLRLMAPQISSSLVRALDEHFAFGSSKSSSFLIFKTHSYNTARGELFGEEYVVAKGLQEIFDISATGTLHFKDRVVYNHDTRTLVDTENKPYLLYSFIDPETLVFAEDDDTFKTIVDRIHEANR